MRPVTASDDAYLGLVSQGPGRKVATALGLPAPVELRRHDPARPTVTAPVVVLGPAVSAQTSQASGQSSVTEADQLATHLLGRGLEVHRHGDDVRKVGAVVLCLTEIRSPADLTAPALELGAVLRKLVPGGRVITVSRPAAGVALGSAANLPQTEVEASGMDYAAVAVNAARQGVVGFLRSTAQEMRGGATANGVVVANGVSVTAPSVAGSLDFLLSGRSAFVDGQFLVVGTQDGPESLAQAPQGETPLAGKVVVVTGAARGIGEQIARLLHTQGAHVVPVDVPAAGQALSTLANELETASLSLDVTAQDAGQKILEHCRTRYGRLDGIVHNAGITRDKMLANMDEAKFASVLAVNTEAPLRITEQLLADPMGDGLRVVGLASTSGVAGNRGQTNYAASKAGIVGMVAGLAPILAQRGGTANAVAPGFIETEMTAKIPMARRQVARRLNSLQQGGLPRDVAEAIAFLLSDAAAGISGQTLRVCGQNLVGA
ncbi:3-oxoacyl-ACP reductase [Kocuria sp.]|uniref:3-oxoacyl-ACP reductase n=1 Tax=Kocuria sp. TaxID=1871328 RepID=UPI0026DFD1BA|nr:3-oxoacyl-ACP reductase [Kocuria sp.]MDO5619127.1 3-oxoacyl-ACP reductase [Kocuria sp.]